MSVPVGKRNKNKFEAIVKTQALVKHILLITKNEKIKETLIIIDKNSRNFMKSYGGIMKRVRTGKTPREKNETDNQNSENIRLRSLIDYLGMMTDVDLPEEEQENE